MSRKADISRGQIQGLSLLGLLFLVLATAVQTSDKSKSANEEQAASSEDQIRQGKYLVHHVAMCVQCHTPKDEKGNLVEAQLLEGAPIPFENPYPNQEWAAKAPKLAGLPGGWSEEDLAQFLETGKAATNHEIHPPMPPFRMKKSDAEAVAAYLKSLGASR